MNKFLSCVSFAVLVVFSFGNSEAQSLRANWGEVSIEDLKMEYCPSDSGAAAYVLSDFGDYMINGNFEFEMIRHRRVKIFNRIGYKEASISLPVEKGEQSEEITNIKATTYNLSENNEIVETELRSEDIFRKKSSTRSEIISFTMPALRPGCIIEFTYKIITPFLDKGHKWVFQSDIPVRWSEFRVLRPRDFIYNKVIRGSDTLKIATQRDTSIVVWGVMKSVIGKSAVPFWINIWAGKDLPAVKDEPYSSNSMNAYLTVEMQLKGIQTYYYDFKFPTRWDEIGEMLSAYDYFTEFREPPDTVKQLAKEIVKDKPTELDKLIAIHEWVRKNTRASIVPMVIRYNATFPELLETKEGTVADVNLLLIALLRCAGIACNPVITATSDFGKIQDIHPTVRQFNYLFAWVKIGEKYLGVDAGTPEIPYNLIPVKLLNTLGLVIKDNSIEWVEITARRKNTVVKTAQINIAPDGSMDGHLNCTLSDYSAMDARLKLTASKEQDAVKNIFGVQYNNFSLDSISITGKDDVNQDLVVSAKLLPEIYLQSSGDLMYLNPAVFDPITATPFLAEERRFAIDFSYPAKNSSDVNFNIPEGYIVQETPPNCLYYTKESGIVYTRKITMDEKSIRVVRAFDIKTSLLQPDMYPSVKTFYEKVIKAEAEQITLVKKTVPKTTEGAGEISKTADDAKKTAIVPKAKIKKK
ncbi:MAG: DUF3857 and transglutaminase domain-containing protein [Ignavibacteriales bacterium]|nr:DUF3857 and transglutaminase domain-containing protein [Ignavibacteriales bacterium]